MDGARMIRIGTIDPCFVLIFKKDMELSQMLPV